MDKLFLWPFLLVSSTCVVTAELDKDFTRLGGDQDEFSISDPLPDEQVPLLKYEVTLNPKKEAESLQRHWRPVALAKSLDAVKAVDEVTKGKQLPEGRVVLELYTRNHDAVGMRCKSCFAGDPSAVRVTPVPRLRNLAKLLEVARSYPSMKHQLAISQPIAIHDEMPIPSLEMPKMKEAQLLLATELEKTETGTQRIYAFKESSWIPTEQDMRCWWELPGSSLYRGGLGGSKLLGQAKNTETHYDYKEDRAGDVFMSYKSKVDPSYIQRHKEKYRYRLEGSRSVQCWMKWILWTATNILIYTVTMVTVVLLCVWSVFRLSCRIFSSTGQTMAFKGLPSCTAFGVEPAKTEVPIHDETGKLIGSEEKLLGPTLDQIMLDVGIVLATLWGIRTSVLSENFDKKKDDEKTEDDEKESKTEQDPLQNLYGDSQAQPTPVAPVALVAPAPSPALVVAYPQVSPVAV